MEHELLGTSRTRDWARVEAASHERWLAYKRRFGPAGGIRMAEALRRHVERLRPDWPSPASRREDLAAHRRLAELFRRVDAAMARRASPPRD